MSQITVGKPDLRTADKRAIALGKFLRHHPLVKSRESILNGERMDIFKLKRAARALLDPSYEKRRKRTPVLPEIKTEEQAYEALKLFPFNRIAFNVQKFETEIALARGLKPLSGVPCVGVTPQQQFGPEEYWAWFYDPVPITSVLYTVGAVVGVGAMIAFPLWPYKLRRVGWFLSMGILGFLGFLLVLAVVRLIVFSITYFLVKPGLWLFPNLFEDLSVIESFKPFYCWHGENALPKKPKKKKRVKTEEQRAAIKKQADAIRSQAQGQPQPAVAGAGQPGAPGAGTPGAPGAPVPGMPGNAPPMVQALMQKAMQQTLMRTEQRKQQYIKENGPLDAAATKALHEKIFQEEARKTQAELEAFSRQAQAQAQAQHAQAKK